VSPVLKLIREDFGVLTRAAHFPKVPAHVELIDEALSPTSFMTVTVLRKSLFQGHEAEFNEAGVVSKRFDQAMTVVLVHGGQNSLVIEEASLARAVSAQR
jgi:hypothetical protein